MAKTKRELDREIEAALSSKPAPTRGLAAFDQETYEDALGWSADRIERELTAISAYMTAHWGVMNEENKQILLREREAIRRAQREQLRAVPTKPPRSSAIPRFKPGQRVDVLTYEGQPIPGTHTVVDGSRWGLDESRFVRVRRILNGERTTEDWPIDRVRPRR